MYPGSNFAATPSPSRVSTASGASCISVESAEYVLAAVNSNNSIRRIARQLSQEAANLDDLKAELEQWFSQVDQSGYRKRAPWSSGMVRAYARYKRHANEHGAAHTAFERCRQETNNRTIPEQHVERARLAIQWGEAAVKYVQLRVPPSHIGWK